MRDHCTPRHPGEGRGEGERLRATGARSTERPARDGRAVAPAFRIFRHGRQGRRWAPAFAGVTYSKPRQPGEVGDPSLVAACTITPSLVIPAKAGTQLSPLFSKQQQTLGPGLRRGDEPMGWRTKF
jgi:hypothetical protein